MHSHPPMDSLPKIIRSIPRHCLRPDVLKSFSYLFRDVILCAGLVALIISTRNIAIAIPLSLLLGVVMTGLFVVAHDAGHRSFSSSLFINNIVGEICSALLIWPFHVWRLSHDTHHRYTHHISKEIAWRPFSKAKVDRLSALSRLIYLWTRTWGYFVGSIFFAVYFVRDGLRGLRSRHFGRQDLSLIYFSVAFTGIVTALMLLATWKAGGWYGIVFLFIIPQFTFQFWMSTFTFFHHTNPDSLFMQEGTWDPGKAQLGSTIHMRYPGWIDWLTHDISWHVPHHVCVGIPHYHLREAHQALKITYPAVVREETFSLEYVRRVVSTCQLAGEGIGGYVQWDRYQEAADRIPSLQET
jgi:omega-6 fatty acid desaturase (delta-12 desaturase)